MLERDALIVLVVRQSWVWPSKPLMDSADSLPTSACRRIPAESPRGPAASPAAPPVYAISAQTARICPRKQAESGLFDALRVGHAGLEPATRRLRVAPRARNRPKTAHNGPISGPFGPLKQAQTPPRNPIPVKSLPPAWATAAVRKGARRGAGSDVIVYQDWADTLVLPRLIGAQRRSQERHVVLREQLADGLRVW